MNLPLVGIGPDQRVALGGPATQRRPSNVLLPVLRRTILQEDQTSPVGVASPAP